MAIQVVVIGLGRFGSSVVETLAQKGCEILALDVNEENVKAITEHATHAVQCDATDMRTLTELGVQNMDIAIVSIGEDIESSVLIVMALKELGVKEIIAKAVTPLHTKILEKLGATQVVYPERDSAIRVATHIVAPNIIDSLFLSPEYCVSEIPAPRSFVGKMLKDTNIRTMHKVNIIAIKRQTTEIQKGKSVIKESVNVAPAGDDIVMDGDILVFLGREDDIEKLSRL